MTRPAILRTTFWLSLSDGLTLFAFAVVSIVVARRLGPAQLGDYSMAMTIGAFAQIVSDAGYSISLARAVAQQPEQVGSFLNHAIATKLWIALAFLPIVFGIGSAHSFYLAQLCAIVMVDVVASCVSFSVLAALRGLGHYVMPQFISSAYSIIAASAATAAIVAGSPLYGAVLIIAIASIFRALHLVWRFHRRCDQRIAFDRSNFSIRVVRSQLERQWRLWVVNIASSLLHRAPLVALGLRGGSMEAGYFSAAFRIYSALRIVPGALFTTAVPSLTSKRSKRTVMAILINGAVIGILGGIGLWLSAPAVIALTFALSPAIEPMQLLAVAFGALSLKTSLEAVLIARHHDTVVTIAVIAAALVTIIAIWILPPTAVWFSWIVLGSEWLLVVVFTLWVALLRWHSS